MKMQRPGKPLRGQQAEALSLDASTCLRQAQRGKRVSASLEEIGYGG